MNQIDLSVVTPTLNEEKFIGKLLDSIINQTVWPKEIVIVDATSIDKTIREIEKRQKTFKKLRYFQVPKSTISAQRNFGVKKTTSQNILFLDADVVLLERDALEKYSTQIEEKRPDLAISTNMPLSSDWKDKTLFSAGNLLMEVFKPIWPSGMAMNLFVRKDKFLAVGGFDEQIKVGEDFELIQRMVKKGYKYLILKKPRVHTSVRRLKEDGRLRFVMLLVMSLILVALVGYRKNPIHKKYKFGDHKDNE